MIVLHNNYFISLKLFWAIRGFILYQIKQMALKLGYNFTKYGKLMGTSWIDELQTWKPHLSYLGL